jgi:hypothetical protein
MGTQDKARLVRPAPLPDALADPVPVVVAGQVLWALALIVLVGRLYLTEGTAGPLTWVCACGILLGFPGLALIRWQHRADRRGDHDTRTGR